MGRHYPYREPGAREPTNNPAQAMGLAVRIEMPPPEPVQLFTDFNEASRQWFNNPSGFVRRPAYVADCGSANVFIVPVSVFGRGVIAERWVLAGGVVKRLPPSVQNDLLGLRDGRWVFLMNKPEGADKWPTMSAAEVGRALLG